MTMSLSRSHHRHFIQPHKNPATATPQILTAAANGNRWLKKLDPENEWAEEPNASMVASKMQTPKAPHSRLNSNKFFRVQKQAGRDRLRTAFFLGLVCKPPAFGYKDFTAGLAIDFCLNAEDLGRIAKTKIIQGMI